MKLIRFFGKLAGSFFVLLVIISTFSSVFLLAFTLQLTDAEFYSNAIQDAAIIEDLPEIAAAQIRYSMTYNPCLEDPDRCEDEGLAPADQEGGPPSYFQALSEKDWEILLSELLPPDWLESQLQKLVSGLLTSIRSGQENINLAISLRDLKSHLAGPSGVASISQVLKAQPDCSEEDLLGMTRILEGKEEVGKDFLSCNPGADFLDDYAPQIEVLLQRSLRDIPDEIDLAGELGGDRSAVKAFGSELPVTVVLNLVRRVILISPLFNLILLLLIALLAVSSFQALGKWWGYPVAISGLLAVALASFVSPAARYLNDRFLLDSGGTGLNDRLVEAASSLGLDILGTLFSTARMYGLITAGIGLTIILMAAILGNRSAREDRNHQQQAGLPSIPDPITGEPGPDAPDQPHGAGIEFDPPDQEDGSQEK